MSAAWRPTARQDVSPGESMPATWIRFATTCVRGDLEIGKGAIGRAQLRPDAATAKAQVLERHLRQQASRRLEEVLERLPVPFVIRGIRPGSESLAR